MSDEQVVARLRQAGCVFAEDEAAVLLEAAAGRDLEAMLAERVAGAPLEHVVGEARFCGLRVAVEPGVFVPRVRTQLLARCAVAAARPHAVVVELCCGAGAVAAVVEARVPGADVSAADVDPAAVRCARRNVRGAVHLGDLYAALPPTLRGRVDVLVANAPYVPSDEVALLPREARDHEPLPALDGGRHGVAVLTRVLLGAREWLAPAGTVLVECAARQLPLLEPVARTAGLDPWTVTDEELAACVLLARPVG